MVTLITHWLRDVSFLTGQYFTNLTPEKYSHILMLILLVGWLMLRGGNRR